MCAGKSAAILLSKAAVSHEVKRGREGGNDVESEGPECRGDDRGGNRIP
jgi:hypothetical protein